MFASPLLGEYETARTVFGLSDEELAALACNGARASFGPEEIKAEIEAGVDAWIRGDE